MEDIQWAELDSFCNNQLRSLSVHRVRVAIQEQARYVAANEEKAFYIEANDLDQNYQPDAQELAVIERFFNLNHEGNLNPFIRKSGAGWLRTNDILGKRKAERDVFLEGDMEAYAKVDIEEAEILGQYAGVEVTEEEWRFLFEGTKEEIQNQKCLGGGTVRLPPSLCKKEDEMEIKEPPRKKRKRGRRRKMKNENSSVDKPFECDICHKRFVTTNALGGHKSWHSRNDPGARTFHAKSAGFESKKKGTDENTGSCPDNFEVMKLYIDPVLAQSDSPLLMINDCRANIYEEQLTEEDEQRKNCEMISVKVNGWPTLIRATKKIAKGEPLYFFYGLQYAKVLEAVDQIKLRKNKNIRVVDAELAKMNHT